MKIDKISPNKVGKFKSSDFDNGIQEDKGF